MSSIIAISSLGLATVLDVVATVLLLRSDFETWFQKVAQLGLIWLVTFVGAIVVIGIAWNDRRQHQARGSSDASIGLMPGSDIHAGDINAGDP